MQEFIQNIRNNKVPTIAISTLLVFLAVVVSMGLLVSLARFLLLVIALFSTLVLCLGLFRISSKFFLHSSEGKDNSSSIDHTVGIGRLKNAISPSDVLLFLVGALVAVVALTFRSGLGQSPLVKFDSVRGQASVSITPPSETNSSQMKIATIQAWKDIQSANRKISSANFSSTTSREVGYLYSTIDLEDADPLLQNLVLSCVEQFKFATDLLHEFEVKQATTRGTPEFAAKIGTILGAAGSEGRNTQDNAAAGALMFGILGEAMQKEAQKKIQQEFGTRFELLTKRFIDLKQAEKTLSETLSKKYTTPFIVAF